MKTVRLLASVVMLSAALMPWAAAQEAPALPGESSSPISLGSYGTGLYGPGATSQGFYGPGITGPGSYGAGSYGPGTGAATGAAPTSPFTNFATGGAAGGTSPAPRRSR